MTTDRSHAPATRDHAAPHTAAQAPPTARLHPGAGPDRTRALAAGVVVWALVYGGLRAYWAAGHAPYFPPVGEDLVILPGWGSVVLCVCAAAVAAVQWTGRSSRVVIVAGFAVAAVMVVADALLLLDVVGLFFGGVGISFDLGAFASRATLFVGAAALTASTVIYRRRAVEACPRCGRTDTHVRLEHPPRWAFVAAYLAVGGCLARVVAQYSAGLDTMPFEVTATAVVFEIAFLLAGTVLPLALVHRWGRIWPRWVLFLAGRRVPRWLVAGPGLGLGAGMSAYFGFMLVQMTVNVARGEQAFDTGGVLSQGFFWIAVPSYVVWAIGMGVAAIAYVRVTRPHCLACGRG